MIRPNVGIRFAAIAALLFVPSMLRAQQLSPEQNIKHGEEVFAQTCTQSYCHGANGAAGGAPKLAGRGLTANYIERVVTYGISGTPMPAWGQNLPLFEVRAVIAYVESLNGIAPSVRSGPPPTLTGEAAHGRDLFFEPLHTPRCSACHRELDRGLLVAPDIATVPSDVAALKDLAAPHVSTVTANGETFPAFVASQVPTETKMYDLTKFPPVLRTFDPKAVTVKGGSSWKHSTVLGSFSDAEFASMLEFLRAAHRYEFSGK
jgi:mono/diheme cytochrome c family protein